MIVKQLDFTTVSLPSLNTRGWSSSLEKWSRVNWEELHFFSVKPIFSSTLLPLSIWRIFFSSNTWKKRRRFWKLKWIPERNELNFASWWFCVAVKSQLIEILMMLVVEKPFLVLQHRQWTFIWRNDSFELWIRLNFHRAKRAKVSRSLHEVSCRFVR